MTASKIIVRLDAEQRTAELEIMTPHHVPPVEGLDRTLRHLGVSPLLTVEMSTQRYRVTRTKLVALDGSSFDGARVMQVLSAARESEASRGSLRSLSATSQPAVPRNQAKPLRRATPVVLPMSPPPWALRRTLMPRWTP